MNWYKLYKIALLEGQRSGIMFDTRNKEDRAALNKEIIQSMGLKVNDIISPLPPSAPKVQGNMWNGMEKNYQITSINPDGTLNLISLESGRKMEDVGLYGMDIRQNNVRRWVKV